MYAPKTQSQISCKWKLNLAINMILINSIMLHHVRPSPYLQEEANPCKCELLVLWSEHSGALWEQELLGLSQLWPVQWLPGGKLKYTSSELFSKHVTKLQWISFFDYCQCCKMYFYTILFVDLCCFQNGDYNKPIPAQYMENLNHGVSGSLPSSETPKTLQWVNCQMLLCRKCNNNQTVKIKQLASFIPRDDVCTLFFSIHYNTVLIVIMTNTFCIYHFLSSL